MMRLTRSISLLVIVALSSYIWSAAQVDWDDDVYYVPSKASQQDNRSNDLWGDAENQYDNQDPLDAYNHRGEEYQGTRGQSYSSSQQPKKGVGKYSRRIMRFHNPATVYIYDSDNVDVYYDEDGTYGIYNYPDRYDYVADRYNPVGISINLWSPGWYPSWDYYYDYMWYSSWYPWYTNRYPYPYSWGGYGYWGPSIWYTNPWFGAVAIGTDTIHTMGATDTELAIIMDFGMDTMQASTTHTMVAMPSPRLTTLMVA